MKRKRKIDRYTNGYKQGYCDACLDILDFANKQIGKVLNTKTDAYKSALIWRKAK